MKPAILFLTILLLGGCGKEGLDVRFRTVYESSAENYGQKKSSMTPKTAMSDYTGFGDFVGTITPGKVTAKFHSIRFIDRVVSNGGMQTMVELISVNWAEDDNRRFADFTNGNSVEMIPEMWGNIDNDGWFAEDNISLKYLGIFPQNFTFEFELPGQYTNNSLDLHSLLPDIVRRDGNIITCEVHFFLQHIKNEGFNYENGIQLNGFVFGKTDSTYIVRQDNIPVGDVSELIRMAQPHCVARSGNYVCPVLTPPANGGSKIITTTISFDSRNIIQQYAGFDNVPYTADDVFVLQRKFWERFSIAIDQI